MIEIEAGDLVASDSGRRVEVWNVALGEWMGGTLGLISHSKFTTRLGIVWDQGNESDWWISRLGDMNVTTVRIPERPAQVPNDARSTPAEEIGRHRAYAVTLGARGYGKRSSLLEAVAARSADLGPCPECHVEAGAVCVAMPDEAEGILGRIHGDRVTADPAFREGRGELSYYVKRADS